MSIVNKLLRATSDKVPVGSMDIDHRQVIGWVGLGVMGKPMAKRLVSNSFDLVVYNRSPEAALELVAFGARRAVSIPDLARVCDVIITMLPDTDDVVSVMTGEKGTIAARSSEDGHSRHVDDRS